MQQSRLRYEPRVTIGKRVDRGPPAQAALFRQAGVHPPASLAAVFLLPFLSPSTASFSERVRARKNREGSAGGRQWAGPGGTRARARSPVARSQPGRPAGGHAGFEPTCL
jgi:hypothetical protein